MLVTQSCSTLCYPIECSFCPWNSPGKNTAVDGHSLFQRIFLTLGPKLDLLHCRQIHYCVSHQKSSQYEMHYIILLSQRLLTYLCNYLQFTESESKNVLLPGTVLKKACKVLKELLIFKSCFPEFTYLRAMESNRVIHIVKTNVLEI